MKTLFDLADEINGLIAAGQGHLPVISVSGSSGVAYPIGSVQKYEAGNHLANTTDLAVGQAFVGVYLGS